jgi:hypothetical protein
VTVELVEAAPVAGALRFKLVRHASAPAQKTRTYLKIVSCCRSAIREE